MRSLNLAGQRFGKLTVIEFASRQGRRTAWHCQCDCGNKTTATTVGLRRKVRPVQSCGCLMIERSKESNTRHGMRRTREYSAWQSMLNRCRNENTKEYAQYGAVGIRVCERWESFENFYADMGPRPTGTTIDRLDGTGDYCPGNCRWATYKQQAENRRSSVYITVPVSTLERVLGLGTGNLLRRLNNGWDLLKALSTKTQEQFARSKAHNMVRPEAERLA